MSLPMIGKKFNVDFGAFKVQLFFKNENDLIYTSIRPDGTLVPMYATSVAIDIKPIGDDLFLSLGKNSTRQRLFMSKTTRTTGLSPTSLAPI